MKQPTLLHPFEPVLLQRPIGPAGKTLRLVPGIQAMPDLEFLTFIATGEKGHKAALRHVLGGNFKNLENHLRGRHELTLTTRKGLAGKLGLPITALDELRHGRRDGPLLPQILDLFQAAEQFFEQMICGFLDVEVACPCCGQNVMNDEDAWWKDQPVRLGKSEYGFIERLISALFGAEAFVDFVATLDAGTTKRSQSVVALVTPEYHPIGNWLREVMSCIGCRNLTELAARLQLQSGTGSAMTHQKLKEWSCGQRTLPLDAALAIQALAPSLSEERLMAARMFALLVDFVTAAAVDAAPSRREAQNILFGRCSQIRGKLRLASAKYKAQQ